MLTTRPQRRSLQGVRQINSEAVEELKQLKFDTLPHTPHSPDLAPSDLHMFGPFKGASRGRKSRDYTNAQCTVPTAMLAFYQKYFSLMESGLPVAGLKVLK
jgi:hypothetical protein